MKNILIVGLLLFFSNPLFSQIKLSTSSTESILYLSKGKKQPLVVGLGGSEGGNAWASNHWKATREQFLAKGYAFLAIGYFGAEGTPKILDKIAVEDIHNAILEATKNTQIDKKKIAIVGGSRGGDLALLVASYYPDIDCVVGIVPSHAVFPGHTQTFDSSCWTYQGKELPFVPVNEESIPFLQKRDLRGAFLAMLKDTASEQKSLIAVEKIQGNILFLSATQDEIAPTKEMADKMMLRLKEKKFKYHYEHIAIEGGHAEPLKHFDKVFAFLEKHFDKPQ